MIIPKRHAHLLATGVKTEIRVPADPDQVACPYTVGRDYAISTSHKRPARGRVEILETRSEALADLTYEGAVAEGHRSREEFVDDWQEQHGVYDPEQLVWVLIVRWCEEVRLLHRDSSRSGGYTTNPILALRDHGEHGQPLEPEAVSEAYQHELTLEAKRRVKERQAEAWRREREQLESSLERLGGVLDPTALREIRVIRRRLAAIDRKVAA